MNFTEEHQLFRRSLRDFLDREVVPHVDEWEEAGELPRSLWRLFGEMGYFGLQCPEAYGGSDLDFGYTVVFLEEVSRCYSAGFAAAITAHPILALAHLAAAGSEHLKDRYLRPGIAGEQFGGLAITEPGTGSNVAGIATRADRRGDHYLVHGAKTFITNGVRSDFLVVAVKTDPEAGAGGISLLVIDREADGLSARPLKKLGWHASDTAELNFDGVRVPVANRIGEENAGFYYIIQRCALERLAMAVSAVAGCDHALEYTLEYMAGREAFGRPINRFQVLRHRLAQLTSEVERARQFNYLLSRAYDEGQPLIKEAAMAKLLSTQLADRVMYECLQCFGGYGYMEDYKIARMFRDSRISRIFGGSNEIMKMLIARSM